MGGMPWQETSSIAIGRSSRATQIRLNVELGRGYSECFVNSMASCQGGELRSMDSIIGVSGSRVKWAEPGRALVLAGDVNLRLGRDAPRRSSALLTGLRPRTAPEPTLGTSFCIHKLGSDHVRATTIELTIGREAALEVDSAPESHGGRKAVRAMVCGWMPSGADGAMRGGR